jgi:hypothetical protein
VTPSKTHLLILDVLLAVLQLATLIVAFGATVPSDLEGGAAGEGEAGREYGGLLGEVEEDWDGEENEEEGEERSARSRRSGGYSAVDAEEEQTSDIAFSSSPIFASSSSYRTSLSPLRPPRYRLILLYPAPKPSSSSSSSSSHIRLTPVADVRFRTFAKELLRGAEASKREGVERRAADAEEGRVEGEGEEDI